MAISSSCDGTFSSLNIVKVGFTYEKYNQIHSILRRIIFINYMGN